MGLRTRTMPARPLHWRVAQVPWLSLVLRWTKSLACGEDCDRKIVPFVSKLRFTHRFKLFMADPAGELDRPWFCEEFGDEFADRDPKGMLFRPGRRDAGGNGELSLS